MTSLNVSQAKCRLSFLQNCSDYIDDTGFLCGLFFLYIKYVYLVGLEYSNRHVRAPVLQ